MTRVTADDTGAVNEAAGLIERDLALDIARRTEAFLVDAGYSVALTRNDNATGYANTPRGTIANLCHAAAYVSIHLNSFGEPEPTLPRRSGAKKRRTERSPPRCRWRW